MNVSRRTYGCGTHERVRPHTQKSHTRESSHKLWWPSTSNDCLFRAHENRNVKNYRDGADRKPIRCYSFFLSTGSCDTHECVMSHTVAQQIEKSFVATHSLSLYWVVSHTWRVMSQFTVAERVEKSLIAIHSLSIKPWMSHVAQSMRLYFIKQSELNLTLLQGIELNRATFKALSCSVVCMWCSVMCM